MPAPRNDRSLRRRDGIDGATFTAATLTVAAALAAATAGCAPTGVGWWDLTLVTIGAALGAWLGGRAPESALIAGALAVAVVASAPVAWAAGAVVVVAAIVGAWRPPWSRPAGSVAAGALVIAAAFGGSGMFFGSTAIAGIGAVTVVAVLGARRIGGRTRRWAMRGAAVVAGGGLIAVIAFCVVLLGARADLAEASRLSTVGLREAQRGDIPEAEAHLREAAELFADVGDQLDNPLLWPSRAIPIVAQHRSSVDGLAADAAVGLSDAADALAVIDFDALAVRDGSIDLEAIDALAAPLADLARAVTAAADALDAADNEWLVPPISRSLDRNRDNLAARSTDIANAQAMVELAPQLLGADGDRVYFVAFVTPAEARGLGGFMGNWAEISVTNGRLAMTAFGSDEDLNRGGDNSRRITGAAEFRRLYGTYGFVEADGTTGKVPWKNITMPADLPTVGEVVAELYPQSGGRQIDGVIVVDVKAIATLLSITGPLRVDEPSVTLNARTAEDFLLRDQYLIGNDQRLDLLDTIARQVVDELLTGSLPSPPELGRLMGPMIQDRHVMLWSVHPDEQALFARIGADGSLDGLVGDADIAIARNNAAANKIDAYLDSTVAVDGNTATITLTNGAPAQGLPFYVIGNLIDAPEGTNRTRLTIYTRFPLTTLTRDGLEVPAASDRELDWYAYVLIVDIAAGDTVQLSLAW